jgi:putative ABC transport system permease protein
MFLVSLKIAIRNFVKHLGFSLINVLGLAIGIACCLLIILFVRDETSYDGYHEKADQTYRIGLHGFVQNRLFQGVVSASPMAPTLVREFPEVEVATRVRNFGFPVFRYQDKVFSEERVYWVDPSFFEVFTVKFIKGSPQTALPQPNTIVLTRSMARKYFGGDDPMGKSLNADKRRDYVVTGVIEDCPRNSHFRYDFLASLGSYEDSRSTFWVSNNYHTYVVLRKGTSGGAFEAKLAELVKKYVGPQIQAAAGITLEQFFASGGEYRYFVQPLKDIHLRSHYEFELEPNGDIAYVYVFSLVALGILLVACVNFVNLATARSATRAREVGIRKTVGSHRSELVRQFLSETIFLSFLAVLTALGVAHLALPAFNNITGKSLAISYFGNPWTIPGLLAAAVFVGLLAGVYPAFFLASFDPVTVLKTEMAGRSRKSRLRNVLVVFQFAVSIILLIGTLIVQRQMTYIQDANLGFNREQVVIVRKTDDLGNQIDAFKQELLKSPAVISATNTEDIIGGVFGNSTYQVAGKTGLETHLLSTCVTDADFIKTYEIGMAAGRFFEAGRPADAQNAVINETAVKSLGMTDPVGKQFLQPGQTAESSRTFTVIGVTKDFNFESLHSPVRPLIIHTRGPQGRGGFVSVRIRPENIRETLAFLEKTWRKMASNQAFEFQFFDDHMDEVYRSEERTKQIFVSFSVLAVFVACLGLLGLAAFIAERRTREIGIRKALGASVGGIIVLLSGEFAKWVVLGNVVAWPVAYFSMKGWLQKFAFRTGITVWPFLLTSAAVLAIALLTVSYQTVKAATANPAESLKYE